MLTAHITSQHLLSPKCSEQSTKICCNLSYRLLFRRRDPLLWGTVVILRLKDLILVYGKYLLNTGLFLVRMVSDRCCVCVCAALIVTHPSGLMLEQFQGTGSLFSRPTLWFGQLRLDIFSAGYWRWRSVCVVLEAGPLQVRSRPSFQLSAVSTKLAMSLLPRRPNNCCLGRGPVLVIFLMKESNCFGLRR